MAAIKNRNDLLLQATSPRVDTIIVVVDYSNLTDDLGIQPDDNADVTGDNTAANVTGQTGFATLTQINSGNIGTYIDNLAIKNAQIATAAITNAKIGTAAVNTLEIQGNAVTITGFSEGTTRVASIVLDHPSGTPVYIRGAGTMRLNATGVATGYIKVGGATVKTATIYGGNDIGGRSSVNMSYEHIATGGSVTYEFSTSGLEGIATDITVMGIRR